MSLTLGALFTIAVPIAYAASRGARAAVKLVLIAALVFPALPACERLLHAERAWTSVDGGLRCVPMLDEQVRVRDEEAAWGFYAVRVELDDRPIGRIEVPRPRFGMQPARGASAIPVAAPAGRESAFVLLRFEHLELAFPDDVSVVDKQVLLHLVDDEPAQQLSLATDPVYTDLGMSPDGPCLRSGDGRQVLRFDVDADGALRGVAWPLAVRARGLVWPLHWAIWPLLSFLTTWALTRELLARWRRLSLARAGRVELTESGPEWREDSDVWRIADPPPELTNGPALALDANVVAQPDGPFRGAVAPRIRVAELVPGNPDRLRLDAGLRVMDCALGVLLLGMCLAWFFGLTITV